MHILVPDVVVKDMFLTHTVYIANAINVAVCINSQELRRSRIITMAGPQILLVKQDLIANIFV
jgi:hypothetical protein